MILFKNMNHRDPLYSEIIENLRDKIEPNTLEKIVEKKMLNMEIVSSNDGESII